MHRNQGPDGYYVGRFLNYIQHVSLGSYDDTEHLLQLKSISEFEQIVAMLRVHTKNDFMGTNNDYVISW